MERMNIRMKNDFSWLLFNSFRGSQSGQNMGLNKWIYCGASDQFQAANLGSGRPTTPSDRVVHMIPINTASIISIRADSFLSSLRIRKMNDEWMTPMVVTISLYQGHQTEGFMDQVSDCLCSCCPGKADLLYAVFHSCCPSSPITHHPDVSDGLGFCGHPPLAGLDGHWHCTDLPREHRGSGHHHSCIGPGRYNIADGHPDITR